MTAPAGFEKEVALDTELAGEEGLQVEAKINKNSINQNPKYFIQALFREVVYAF